MEGVKNLERQRRRTPRRRGSGMWWRDVVKIGDGGVHSTVGSEDNITWQEGRDPTSTVPSGEVSDGACPKGQ